MGSFVVCAAECRHNMLGRKFMANWIIIVDDDTIVLKTAGQILSKAGMRVTVLKSG